MTEQDEIDAVLAFQKEWPLEINRREALGPIVEETLDWLLDSDIDFAFFWGGRCTHEGCAPHKSGYHLRTCTESIDGLRRHYNSVTYGSQPTYLYVRFKDNLSFVKFKLLWT